MAHEILVGTRKGLFAFAREGSEWRAPMPWFLGEPISAFLEDKRSGYCYASLATGHFGVKFRRSKDRGETWQELAAPTYPEGSDKALSMIWTMEPGGENQPGRIWAGTLPGGLFVSDNHGEDWQIVEALWNRPEREKWMGGGYDDPGIHSICIDPRNADRITLGVSVGGVWMTSDGGETWQQGGNGMRAAYMPPEMAYAPETQDPHRLHFCASNPDRMWCQHHNGIFVSDDFGATFRELSDTFGFAVIADPNEPDCALFAPGIKDECRVPKDARFVVSGTDDGGKTFFEMTNGLPRGPAYDLVYRHAMAVSPDGQSLAMGSTTGNLWISEDRGESWSLISGHLPPIAQVAFS